jgi:hypothetical protein
MYYDDHMPPHFHAYYNEQSALISLDNLELIEGNLSRKALGLIKEWAIIHHAELWNNWELSLEQKPLLPIQPLD